MIIDEHLLLDLPLNGIREGEWRDNSGRGWSVAANGSCEETELALIGSCLHLKSGGRLTLIDPLDGPLAEHDLMGGDLTVEFWALPDRPEAFGSLLGGLLEVSLKEDALEWSVAGADRRAMKLPAPEAPGGVPAPHHWALVLTRDWRSSRVYRDGVDISRAPTSVDGGTADDARTTDLVVGGSRERGWRGKLAHLRLWSTALEVAQIERNRSRDVTAHAAFKTSTGIEWRLLNALEEPSLYIHGNESQMLHLEVINVLHETRLVFDAGGEVSREAYQLQLVFRPGTIADHALRRLPERFAEHTGNDGWSVKRGSTNGEDYLSFLRNGTVGLELASGAMLRLYLPGLAAAPGAGSRTTRVALNYRKLHPKGSAAEMAGHRAQLLNIVYRAAPSAYRRPPLDVGVLGAPSVLNNGTKTRLTLYIRNVKRGEDGQAVPLLLGSTGTTRDEAPRFVLEIDASDPDGESFEGAGLADRDDLAAIELSAAVWPGNGTADTADTADTAFATVDPLGESGNTFRWSLAPMRVVDGESGLGFGADETLFLTLSDLVTTALPGRVVLRLRYEDFERYGEGVYEIPIDKVAAVPAKLGNGGIGYGLALGHDPRGSRVASPGTELAHEERGKGDMDEVLSVRQQGDGDAVSIESVGGGAALSVRQESEDPDAVAARFSGGSVVLDGDIRTGPTHTWYVERDGWAARNRKFVEFEGGYKDDRSRGQVHLYAPSNYYDNVPALTLAGNYGAGGKVGIGTTDPESSLHVNGRIRDKSGEVMPVGTVVAFAGKTAPDGWLMCRGQRVSDTEKYADLAGVLGVRLPFNVPNYQERFVVGAHGNGEYDLGKTGGASRVRLTRSQMPRHGHDVSVAEHHGHTHRVPVDTGGGGQHGSGRMYKPGDKDSKIMGNVNANDYWNTFEDRGVSGSRKHSVRQTTSGGGSDHENRPKFVALNYIIKY